MYMNVKTSAATTARIKTIKCPKCGRRAFDVSKWPRGDFEIQMKCPHCHNVVSVPVPDLAAQ